MDEAIREYLSVIGEFLAGRVPQRSRDLEDL